MFSEKKMRERIRVKKENENDDRTREIGRRDFGL
jgi:hypothetical protein